MKSTRKMFEDLRRLIAIHMKFHKNDPDYYSHMFEYVDAIRDALLFTNQFELNEMLRPYWIHFLHERGMR